MRQKLRPLLALTLMLALAYLPLLWGSVLYQRDVGRHIYPEQSFLHHSLASGDSPMWNPRIGLGIATMANPVNQLLYPPSAVYLVAHSPRVTSWFLFFHLVLGGLGMMALVRRLVHVPVAAALVSGLAWCLSGVTTSEVIAGVLLISGAYLPWCALGLLHLSRLIQEAAPLRRRWAGVAWAALPFGLCFSTGEIFSPLLAGVFALCVVVGDVWSRPQPRPSRRTWLQMALFTCLAAGLACALAAAMVWPAMKAAKATDRSSALPRQVAEVGSFHPWRMAEMIAQGAMGDPYTDYPAGPWVGEAGLGERPLLYGAYLGCSVLALGLLAFARRRSLATVLGVTAGFFLLVSFGRHFVLHAGLRTLIPPLAFMRGPEKYLVVVTASLALLAGLGCARLLQAERAPWRRTLSIPLVLLALAWAAQLFPNPMITSVRSGALSSLAFALGAVALSFLAGRRPRWAGPLLVGLVLVDLTRSVFALQNFGPPSLLSEVPPAARAILTEAQARGQSGPPRVHRPAVVDTAIAQAAAPDSVAEVQRNLTHTLIGNHAGSFGLGCVPGYDAALPSSISSLWAAGPLSLRLTGTEYVMLPQATPPSSDLRPLLDPAPGVRLFHLQGVLPRVYLSQAQAILPDAVAKSAVFAPEIVSGKRVVLAPSPPVPASVLVGSSAESAGQCRLSGFANTRVEADCESSAAALAVFLEQYAEGWSASVDGQATPLLRANLAMRAVPLAPGKHHIVLEYSTPGLRLGWVVSLAALVILAALLWVGRAQNLADVGSSVTVMAKSTSRS
jgi:hypothetical protein